MYWGHGFGMGWTWFAVLLGLLALAALVILVVRSFTAGPHTGWHGSASEHGDRGNARAILEERLVRGEITPDQYREIVRALDETSAPPPAS
ncbi:MAG TPA: SHOCT domain-containing protein [Agromyces sp.]|nr:SHOCT domain-containing protein [Agromyces sp.]